MTTCLRLFLCIASLCRFACAEDEADLAALGKRMVSAVKDNSLENYKACWLSIEKMRGLIGPEIDRNPKYFADRDKAVEQYFPKLRKALADAGFDVASASLESASGKIQTHEELGLTKTSRVMLTLKDKDGVLAALQVDDGIKHKGVWYFADRPMPDIEIRKDGKQKKLTVAVEASDPP